MIKMRLIAPIIIISATILLAQNGLKWRGSDGWGVNDRYEMQFNNYGLQTIKGVIDTIDTITPISGMATGVKIVVNANNRQTLVHLGPSWFVIHQDMSLKLKDEVEVRGAQVSINSRSVIMAVDVKCKDRILKLRDELGVPYWCMWRKK